MRAPPARRRRREHRASSSLGAASVMSVSTSSRFANRTSDSASSFEESASTTTRRAACTMADFAAASASSGVLRPKSAVTPLAPTKARSGRMSLSWAIVAGPTAAPVMPRTEPPSSRSMRCGLPAVWMRPASGTEFVETSRLAPGASGVHVVSSSASRPVVLPASSSTEPRKVGGIRASAARAIASFWVALRPRRSSSEVSAREVWSAPTAPPCTRRRRPSCSRVSRSRRMVSVVTPKSRARPATETRPTRSRVSTIW